MDQTKKNEYRQKLLELIPPFPESIGNYALREKLRKAVEDGGDHLDDSEYWPLRDSLIDEGLIEQGRGRGGSVHHLAPEEPKKLEPPTPLELVAKPESELYVPFQKAITTGYVQNYRIKRFVSQITASQGRRSTGGKWTRPDLTLIAVRTYSFTPGKRLEVITFELKANLDSALEAVFEALAHSAFAHRSYLAVDISSYGDDVPDERIAQECSRLGIGYITFEKPGEYETFEIVTPAKLIDPDPDEVDKFMQTQIAADKLDDLRELLR